MTTTEPSLRDRRRQETTTLIAEAAVDLALDRGWADVTVDDIAARAGISRRTFFNYFPSKDEALFHLAMTWQPELLAQFAASTGPVLDALEVLVLAQTGSSAPDRERGRRIMGLVGTSPELLPGLLSRLALGEVDLARAVAEREGLGGLESQVLAGTVGTVVRVASSAWLCGDQPDPATAVRAAFAALRSLTT